MLSPARVLAQNAKTGQHLYRNVWDETELDVALQSRAVPAGAATTHCRAT